MDGGIDGLHGPVFRVDLHGRSGQGVAEVRRILGKRRQDKSGRCSDESEEKMRAVFDAVADRWPPAKGPIGLPLHAAVQSVRITSLKNRI